MDSHIKELSYAAPSLIGLFTIPSVWRYFRNLKQVKPSNHAGMYEDKDGVATEESMAKYSTKLQFVIIFTSFAVGLSVSFALAVFATVRKDEGFTDLCLSQLWLLFTSWILTLIQVLETSREKQPVLKFQRGIFNSISCVLIFALGWAVFSNEFPPEAPERLVLGILNGVQILAAAISTLTFYFVERRPDVFRPNGKVVERQFKRSLWSRYAFDWSYELLDLASEKLIEVDDLPAMDAKIRSKDAKESFKSIVLKPSVSLWLQVFWAFRKEIMTQWILSIFSAVFDAGPQFAVLKLLQYLEVREGFDVIDPRAWTWVAGLFAATIAETLMDNRINWLMWSELAIPIRSALTSLIFEKMMKMKDCKEPPKPDAEEDAANSKSSAKPGDGSKINGDANINGTAKPNTTNGHPPDAPKDKKKDDADEKKKYQSEKDIINMFAVDTNQVAVFGAVNQFYIMFFSKFMVSIVFLWLLVGWQSLGAGMFAIVLMAPINQALTKRYGGFQKELMKARDKKTAIVTEALNGIRQIKFSASEPQWSEKISGAREEEIAKLWKTKINNLYMMIGSSVAPVLLTILSLATYSYINGDLVPSVAFTALGVFMQLEGVLGMVPFLFMMGINAKVSCDRIDNFLRSPEKPENTYPGDAITFDKVSVSFPSKSEVVEEERFVLRDLTLSFPNNALSVISGPTGSGKSLLLSAILGEVEVLSGNITVPRPPLADERHDDKATAANWLLPSAIAFVSQTPWIENATIKDNILFGLPFDSTRYQKVLNACALTKDLDMFDDGDLTEVGAQGISLSGGQKWRLTLARAFYSRASILILDDVFSALDAHVGKEIYDNALMGELSEGRTRILVTHHVSLCLPRAKYAVQLSKSGVLEHAGLIDELREAGDLEDIMKAEQENLKDEEEDKPSETLPETNGHAKPSDESPAKPKKLIEEEKRETGSVKASVYLTYLKATGGIPFWALVFMFYLVAEGFVMGRSWWIKTWTASYEHTAVMTSNFNSSHLTNLHAYTIQQQLRPSVIIAKLNNPFTGHHTLGYYLLGYVAISMVSVFVATARYYLIYRGSLTASRNVFKNMTDIVLRTPLRWLDTVPTGRILNRFTADFSSMDSQLSSNFAQTASSFLEIIGIMVSAFFVSPYIIIIAVLLLSICTYIGHVYIKGARSIKRLESIQKSPMISHFSSALAGLSTIRAFANGPIFETKMHELIDGFASATWHSWLFNRWFGLRMALVGSFFSSAVAAFIVSTRGVDASLAGFALAFALTYRRAVIYTIRLLASTELDMNAAERIFEYTELETEPQGGTDNIRASWPEEGKLEVTDLEVGYAEGLPLILKGLTFTAEKNQRVGIVGRTGAGKSTLSLALFRFLEARAGSIHIDGIDISTLKLHDLRTRLSIIPQDPVLFSGTIRSNLDPFDEFSDQQLKEALQRVHLIPSANSTPSPELETPAESSSSTANETTESTPKENTNIFLSLSSPISSAGANLSQGQKQLLCLARAILSRPKVLLLDEATSAVDMNTDALIQRSIREEFANTTLLVVAHRLSTVADFDRILVMKDGVAAEFGSPNELLGEEDGVFRSMVEMSGEREELEGTIRGAGVGK